MTDLAYGDRVFKHAGDTHPTGTVVGFATTLQGKTRVVVELDVANLLHIYSPEQLTKVGDTNVFIPFAPLTVDPFKPFTPMSSDCLSCGKQGGHPVGEACPGLVITCGGDGGGVPR